MEAKILESESNLHAPAVAKGVPRRTGRGAQKKRDFRDKNFRNKKFNEAQDAEFLKRIALADTDISELADLALPPTEPQYPDIEVAYSYDLVNQIAVETCNNVKQLNIALTDAECDAIRVVTNYQVQTKILTARELAGRCRIEERFAEQEMLAAADDTDDVTAEDCKCGGIDVDGEYCCCCCDGIRGIRGLSLIVLPSINVTVSPSSLPDESSR